MNFVSYKNLNNTIKHNSWRIRQLNPAGLIGIPRSGMLAAIMLSEELNIGCCSVNEFIDYFGNKEVFKRHGNRPIDHNDSNTYIVIDDTCYNGSMKKYVDVLRKTFTDCNFVSLVIYLEGPCKIYTPDIYFNDIRKEVLNDYPPVSFYEWSGMDNWWNWTYLFDLDGVICKDPPCDIDKYAYEDYINDPVPLHIPKTPSGRPITICTYRLNCYDKQTRDFLKKYEVNYDKLWMFPAQSKAERDKTPPAQYKGEIYKRHPEYSLFVESNDLEAQQICRISKKPVFCYENGRLYKYNTQMI